MVAEPNRYQKSRTKNGPFLLLTDTTSILFSCSVLVYFGRISDWLWLDQGTNQKKRRKTNDVNHEFNQDDINYLTFPVSVSLRQTKKLGNTGGGGGGGGVTGETDDMEVNCSSENCDEGIIQLHDLRLSPIPSLRNRHHPIRGSKLGPPSLRFIRRSDKRYSSGWRSSSSGTSAQLKKTSSMCGGAMPKIKDVNLIDKYSRFVFPASFAIFNSFYWGIYCLL